VACRGAGCASLSAWTLDNETTDYFKKWQIRVFAH
jgi:hypothetical protein